MDEIEREIQIANTELETHKYLNEKVKDGFAKELLSYDRTSFVKTFAVAPKKYKKPRSVRRKEWWNNFIIRLKKIFGNDGTE